MLTCVSDNKFASRLTFFDHGAIVLSSGSRPPLKAGSTIFVGVTSLGRRYGGDFCEYPPTPADQAAGQLQLSHVKEYRITVTIIPKRATVQFAIAISFLCLFLFLLAWVFAACPCLFPWACYSRKQLTLEEQQESARHFKKLRRRLRPYWHKDDLEAEVEIGWSGCNCDCLKRAFSLWFHTAATGRRVSESSTITQTKPVFGGDPVVERPYSYSWFFLATISAFFITAIQFVM